MDLQALKEQVAREVDQRAGMLIEIAKDIHANPELGFHEYKAAEWLTAPLEEAGFNVRKGVAGLETAFVADWRGGSGPVVGLVAEYDALRGLGHACGHNLIGTAAVGAALALKAAKPDLAGTVKVIGTPFEEGGGGKIIMVDQDVFDGLDAAMLCHPYRRTMVARGGLACVPLTFRYYGKSAHASATPERGISALDAVLQLFFGINQLRQFAPQGYRIHGIITKGGDAPNIVPQYAEAEFIVRAENKGELVGLKQKVIAIAEAAAASTGARLEVDEGLTYAERRENPPLSETFADNLRAIGLRVDPVVKGLGSSDMGNVGEVCPMIHPYVKIVDESVANHTPEFAVAAGSEAGMQGMIQAAKALAFTTLDLCYNPDVLEATRASFDAYRREVAPAG